MTVYAQWKKNSSGGSHSTRKYTLTYESNGGTAYKDERYSSGTKVTLDKVPIRESYTFTGWYADQELTDKITSVTMNSDKTVYAGWVATGVPDMLNGDDHYAYVIGYRTETFTRRGTSAAQKRRRSSSDCSKRTPATAT